jgi:putative mycofactocin binding protein MftB
MEKRYTLHPLCRVRKEKFGLLFYDMRGPRLLFAATPETISPNFLGEAENQTAELSKINKSQRRQLLSFFDSMVKRGFLCEQPIC